MANASRDHLVPKVKTDRNGRQTTVYVKPDSGVKPTERSRSLAVPPPSSVSTSTGSEEVTDPEDDAPEQKIEHVIVKRFEPDVEWGSTHLNRRNLRIIKGIDEFDDDIYTRMFHAAEESADDSDYDPDYEDFERAFAQTFTKWDKIVSIEGDPTIDVPEDAYRRSNLRHALLSIMSDSPRVCRGIATEINARKASDDVADVEPADVRASLELMRDASSDENLAMQTRAYALRNRRYELYEQISALQAEVAAAEAPLRELVQTNETYTLNLGDDGYAAITYTPRTRLNTDRALEDLSDSEKERITVESYNWDLLEKVVGKKRAESYRDPSSVAVSIK